LGTPILFFLDHALIFSFSVHPFIIFHTDLRKYRMPTVTRLTTDTPTAPFAIQGAPSHPFTSHLRIALRLHRAVRSSI
jgi:hypothetical protein